MFDSRAAEACVTMWYYTKGVIGGVTQAARSPSWQSDSTVLCIWWSLFHAFIETSSTTGSFHEKRFRVPWDRVPPVVTISLAFPSGMPCFFHKHISQFLVKWRPTTAPHRRKVRAHGQGDTGAPPGLWLRRCRAGAVASLCILLAAKMAMIHGLIGTNFFPHANIH